MNDPRRIINDELERFLDGQMTAQERADFEARLAGDLAFQECLDHRRSEDAKIEETLRSAFRPTATSVDEIERWLEADRVVPQDRVHRLWSRRTVLTAAMALTASIVGLMVVGNWFGTQPVRPFFEPRSLAAIYLETVEQGFRPYYFCDDEDRFAAMFAKRQGVSLRLAPLPPKRSMVGLSYLGGLSRDTTTMLCFVEDQPVAVFVDQIDHGSRAVVTISDDQKLFVHQSTLGKLVLIEVSPFDQPKMIEFLTIPE